MIASNPTLYVQVVASYVEVWEEYGSQLVLKLIISTNTTLVCTCDKSWKGLKASTPYPFM